MGDILREARAFAEASDDPVLRAKVTGFMAGHAYLADSPAACAKLCASALALARSTGDTTLQIAPNLFLGQAEYAFGRYRRGIATFGRNVRLIDLVATPRALGVLGRPLLVSWYWIAISRAEIGQFSEDEMFARKMTTAGNDLQPFDLAYARLALGFVLMTQR